MQESDYDLTYENNSIVSSYKHQTMCPVIRLVTELKLDTEKFILDNYFSASYYQRRDFMMGVHDSQGSQDEDSVVMYFKTNEERFARDVQKMSWSVSGVSELKFVTYTIRDKMIGNHTDKDIILISKYPDANKLFSQEYNKDFPPHKSLSSVISSIRTIEKQEAACIKIADRDCLYVTDDYIPTHNTTIINGLSYALYGKPITPSKQDHMVNNTNNKNMMVTIDFEINGVDYRIERGRKPNKLRMLKLDGENEEILSDDNVKDNEKDRAHGENKDTQKEIDSLIEITYLLFKYIIAMNTYSTHFMSAGASEQREVIEQILGIDSLSRKAIVLGERIKQTKIDIDKETIRVETIQQANDRVLRNIENLKVKEKQWEEKKVSTINDIVSTLQGLGDVDINKEISAHKHNQDLKETLSQVKMVEKELHHYKANKDRLVKELTDLHSQLDSFEKSICPTCNQEIQDNDEHTKHKELLTENIDSKLTNVDTLELKIEEYEDTLNSITVTDEFQETFYRNIDDAYNHKSTMDSLLDKAEEKKQEENPYTKQIDDLENGDLGLQEINFQALKDLERKLSHEKFLQKLLTNRDSFVRKRIIDYSLPFLNKVFQKYIDDLSLPHQVVFDPNLTFSISDKGREISFNNLSRGEQNRVTFALNLAFRDLYENLVRPVNCLFVDEILDFGMDTVGAKDGLEILKRQARDLNKAVYLVTHKEELMEHADKTILVRKENGFTTYEYIDS
jgi:DNA repair exonuclease SbcCD ATPase subunit